MGSNSSRRISESNSSHVIVVGAGYGGVAAAKKLDSLHFKVTVIEPQDAMQHKIASLRGAVVPGWERRVRVPLDKLLKGKRGSSIIREEVVNVESGKVTLASGRSISADYIILAHGGGKMNFPLDTSAKNPSSDAYAHELTRTQDQVRRASSILVVGGGPTGLEFAGEVRALYPNKKITIVHAGPTLLSNSTPKMHPKLIEQTMEKLASLNIDVILSNKVTNLPKTTESFIDTPNQRYTLSDGSVIQADLTFVAAGGFTRAKNIVDERFIDPQGRIIVDDHLEIPGLSRVYCIGDANNVNETKMAFFAGQQAEFVVQNLANQITGKPIQNYVPMGNQAEYGVMFVPLGPNKGVGAMGEKVFGDSMVSLAKGKGLFTNKTFANLNAKRPELTSH